MSVKVFRKLLASLSGHISHISISKCVKGFEWINWTEAMKLTHVAIQGDCPSNSYHPCTDRSHRGWITTTWALSQVKCALFYILWTDSNAPYQAVINNISPYFYEKDIKFEIIRGTAKGGFEPTTLGLGDECCSNITPYLSWFRGKTWACECLCALIHFRL